MLKRGGRTKFKKSRYWCFTFTLLNIKIIKKKKLQKQNSAVNKTVKKLSYRLK